MLSLMKSRRQELILELIDGEGLRSQEQLRRRLAKALHREGSARARRR